MRDHFNLFTELAVDPKDGSIYLARQSGLVRKVSPQGVMTPVAGTDSQDGPREDGIPAVGAYVAVDSLAVDPATGTLYISGYEGGIRAVAADGIIRRVVPVEALPTGGPGPGGRTRGLRLAFSPLNGALYILEPEHHRVLRLDGDHLTPMGRINDPNPGCTDLGPGQSLDLQVVGRALNSGGTIPSDTTAIVLQLTSASPAHSGATALVPPTTSVCPFTTTR